MLSALLLSLMGFNALAGASAEFTDAEFLNGAKPLIERFTAEQARAFGVEFPIDQYSWAIKTPLYGRHAFASPVLHGGRWDWSCRDVSVQLQNAAPRRAHFYVKVTYPQNKVIHQPRHENLAFELVPTCNRLKFDLVRPEMVIDGVNKVRLFADEDFIRIATPMIQALLREQGKNDELDSTSFELRKKGVDLDDNRGAFGWVYAKIFPRNVACRRVRVTLPRENARLTTYVSVLYGRDDKVPYLPEYAQSILMDTVSFRPYRFALVNGCDRGGFFEPAQLKLKPLP